MLLWRALAGSRHTFGEQKMRPITREDHRYRELNDHLEARLRAFNEIAAGPLRRTPIALTVREDGGDLIGGLIGEMFWNALYIVSLWVEESYRRSGYGSGLLREAEEAARANGCQVAYLSTFDFQAPSFYVKHGYELFGELTSVPPGSNRKWMRKNLGATIATEP
jgi:ribosomal protein S18 acetylase RimI-like enzyme